MRKNLVSVVIPAYNAEAFLERTVRSIRMQTYADLQIIIVDDGSKDRTADLVRELMAADARIGLISKSNGGVASARNAGLAAATGDYVAFVDADDLSHPRKIEELVAALEADANCCAAFSLYCNIDRDDKITRFQPGFGDWRRFSLPSHLILQPVQNASSILVRRADAVAVGGYDSSYANFDAGGCEDLDFELKLAARGPIVMVPHYLVGYRLYEGNMSSNRPRMARAMLAAVDRCLQRNPQLSDRVQRWARRTAYGYAISNLIRGGDIRAALFLCGKFFLADPGGAVAKLLLRAPSQLIWQLRRRKAADESYWDIGANVGGFSDPALLRRAQRPWLIEEDALWIASQRASGPRRGSRQSSAIRAI